MAHMVLPCHRKGKEMDAVRSTPMCPAVPDECKGDLITLDYHQRCGQLLITARKVASILTRVIQFEHE